MSTTIDFSKDFPEGDRPRKLVWRKFLENHISKFKKDIFLALNSILESPAISFKPNQQDQPPTLEAAAFVMIGEELYPFEAGRHRISNFSKKTVSAFGDLVEKTVAPIHSRTGENLSNAADFFIKNKTDTSVIDLGLHQVLDLFDEISNQTYIPITVSFNSIFDRWAFAPEKTIENPFSSILKEGLAAQFTPRDLTNSFVRLNTNDGHRVKMFINKEDRKNSLSLTVLAHECGHAVFAKFRDPMNMIFDQLSSQPSVAAPPNTPEHRTQFVINKFKEDIEQSANNSSVLFGDEYRLYLTNFGEIQADIISVMSMKYLSKKTNDPELKQTYEDSITKLLFLRTRLDTGICHNTYLALSSLVDDMNTGALSLDGMTPETLFRQAKFEALCRAPSQHEFHNLFLKNTPVRNGAIVNPIEAKTTLKMISGDKIEQDYLKFVAANPESPYPHQDNLNTILKLHQASLNLSKKIDDGNLKNYIDVNYAFISPQQLQTAQTILNKARSRFKHDQEQVSMAAQQSTTQPNWDNVIPVAPTTPSMLNRAAPEATKTSLLKPKM